MWARRQCPAHQHTRFCLECADCMRMPSLRKCDACGYFEIASKFKELISESGCGDVCDDCFNDMAKVCEFSDCPREGYTKKPINTEERANGWVCFEHAKWIEEVDK